MAGFSEAYYSNAGKLIKATNSMWTSGKYFLDPELRAKRIVMISQHATVEFTKAFWFLAESELMQTLPKVITSSLKVNKVVTIPPECLQMPKANAPNEFVDIPIPTSHLGESVIKARLLSAIRRDGMIGEQQTTGVNCTRTKVKNIKSPYLIVHCHGGGFVAQSSKSHEIYLKEWATKLNIPILSIDYSLAPQAPYPRALEEVFYAYCWAIKNCHLLGSTAEKVIIGGDSAGGNLSLGCCIKAIESGIRKPDGVFIAYCPVLISFAPCPARILCVMDPLLPFGFLMRCLKAYAYPKDVDDTEKVEGLEAAVELESDDIRSRSSPPDTPNSQTFMNVSTIDEKNQSNSDNSDSFEENSVWEHIQPSESDMQYLQAHKSPISECTSDTLAGGTSFRSQTTTTVGGGGNTVDMLTPDDINDDTPFDDCDDDIMNDGKVDKQSTEYVTEFLERYVLDTTIDSEGKAHPILRSVSKTQSEENIIFDVGRETITVQNLQEKIQKVAEDFATVVQTTITTMTTSNPINQIDPQTVQTEYNNDALLAISPSNEFLRNIPNDPYLSPYLAADDIFKEMPPTKIVGTVLDPCLDDCVMYAKKLKKFGVPVGLDILEGLPHGFLNFAMVSLFTTITINCC